MARYSILTKEGHKEGKEAASSLLKRHPRDELGEVVRERFIKGETLFEGSIELNMALAVALFYFSMYKICLVTGAREESAEAMGILQAPTVEEILEGLSRSLPEATVHVVPAGGLVVPCREG